VVRTGDERIVLGVITRPHGLRGEVRVHRYNPDSTLLREVERVIVRQNGSEREFAVRGHKESRGGDVLRLAGVERVEDAEALRGAEVCVLRSRLPELAPDEYYHVDLIGLRVIEAGVDIGDVIGVARHPSVDALRVRTARGVIEIPILDPYVVEIAVERGTIEVAHSEDFDPEPERPGRLPRSPSGRLRRSPLGRLPRSPSGRR
jgi:16S rRNA processing protein RimM